MPNEENTRQMNSGDGQQIGELITLVRSLATRFTGLESRLTSVEEIIVARFNDTRPLEHRMMARLDELVVSFAAMREEQAAMREEQAAMREDLNKFRQETNHNFRIVSQKLAHLNDDFLEIRAEHTLLEKRVLSLEERAA